MNQQEHGNNYDVWRDPEVAPDLFKLVLDLASGKRDQGVCAGKITRMRGLEQRGDILTAVVDIRTVAYRVTLARVVTDAQTGRLLMSPEVRSFIDEQESCWRAAHVMLPRWGGEFLYAIDPVAGGPNTWN